MAHVAKDRIGGTEKTDLQTAARAGLAAIIALLAVTIASPALASGFTVSNTSDSGPGSLRNAIITANSTAGANTIKFSVNGTITLKSNLPVIANTSPGSLTIDGSGKAITLDGATAYEIFKVNTGATLNLRFLTLANGSVTAVGGTGGGIENGGTLTVTGSIFNNNSATYGGGIFSSGTLTITDSTFGGNSSNDFEGDGGAIFNYFGTATVTNSIFYDNSTISDTDGTDGGNGGATINDGGRLTVSDSVFSDNTAIDGLGGGIFNYNGATLTLTNSMLLDNSTTGGLGGGIFNLFSTATVTSGTLSDNSATDGGSGGGIFNEFGTLTVTDSTFSDNSATDAGGSGGGILNFGTLTATNSTFYGNSAHDYGGGIANYFDSLAALTSSTFDGNSAGIGAGGLLNLSTLTVKSTILAASPGLNCGGSVAVTDVGYNISDDASCGFSKTGSANNGEPVNPLFAAAGLANNGGPTETIALQPTSPAIDAIPVADCADQLGNPLNTDQRGALRPDAGEVFCDIGAYEFEEFAGKTNCPGKNASALSNEFGTLEAAASAYNFPSVQALQAAIAISCGG